MTKKSFFQKNHRDLLSLFRSSHPTCSAKKGVLKKFENFKGKHLCWSLFLMIGLQLYLKKTLTLVFSCEICENFKNVCERLLLFVSPQNTIANGSE